MTTTTKHSTLRQLQTANATAEQARARNNILREQFPPRSAEARWLAPAQSADEVLRRLTSPPFLPAANATRAGRQRGVAKFLRWLSSLQGDTWQQRWKTGRVEEIPGADWTDLPLRFLRQSGPSPSYERGDLTSGLLMLVCGDVIRPDLAAEGLGRDGQSGASRGDTRRRPRTPPQQPIPPRRAKPSPAGA